MPESLLLDPFYLRSGIDDVLISSWHTNIVLTSPATLHSKIPITIPNTKNTGVKVCNLSLIYDTKLLRPLLLTDNWFACKRAFLMK